jgi:hypothetical protein
MSRSAHYPLGSRGALYAGFLLWTVGPQVESQTQQRMRAPVTNGVFGDLFGDGYANGVLLAL